MQGPIKNESIRDIIKIGVLRLLKIIIKIDRGSIDILDSKRS